MDVRRVREEKINLQGTASDSIFSELMSMTRGEYDRGRSDTEKLHSFTDYNHGCRHPVVKTLYDKEGNCTVFVKVEKKSYGGKPNTTNPP